MHGQGCTEKKRPNSTHGDTKQNLQLALIYRYTRKKIDTFGERTLRPPRLSVDDDDDDDDDDDNDDDDDDGIELHVKIQHLRIGCVNPACLSVTVTVSPYRAPPQTQGLNRV